MNTFSNQARIALLTVATLVMSSHAALAMDSLWKGSATGSTQAAQDQAAAPDQDRSAGSFVPDYTVVANFGGWGGGQLGNFSAEGIQAFNADLEISGQATWVCADGATLLVTYQGNFIITEYQDFPYRFTATLTVQGGTGRLANATGSAVMEGGFSDIHGKFYFDFEGSLCTHGNFHEFGIVQIESLSCGLGQTSPYTMEAWNPITGTNSQTGSIMPTSDPVLDESYPGLTVWSFTAQQGPNPYYFDLPLHVINSRHGLIFCTWEAQFRIELNHAGQLVKRCDGLFTVVGGTGRYEHAWGAWQILYATEPTLGEDSATAVFVMNGTLQMAPFESHSNAKIYQQKQ